MNEPKINIQAHVSNTDEAKELLDDLEVLAKKYEIATTISISHQVNLEEFYKLP